MPSSRGGAYARYVVALQASDVFTHRKDEEEGRKPGLWHGWARVRGLHHQPCAWCEALCPGQACRGLGPPSRTPCEMRINDYGPLTIPPSCAILYRSGMQGDIHPYLSLEPQDPPHTAV
jgi:hypothetical protein